MMEYIARVGVCLFVCAVLSGCSSTAGFRNADQQYAAYPVRSCPVNSTRYCDSRRGEACRCISRGAVQDFKNSF